MKLLPKMIFVLGLLLMVFNFAVPNKYRDCHSDLIITGFNDSLSCLPDFVYQISEASFYAGIICIFGSFTLNEIVLEKES